MILEFWIELLVVICEIDDEVKVCVIVILFIGKYFFVGMDLFVFLNMKEDFKGDLLCRVECMCCMVMLL